MNGQKKERKTNNLFVNPEPAKTTTTKKYKVQEYIRNIYVNGSNNDNKNTVKVSCGTNHRKFQVSKALQAGVNQNIHRTITLPFSI